MDSFENLVRLLLENSGYWTRHSQKVNVTKEEKRKIGKHSIPRPEIDLLAFESGANKVIALEVKSFLDSPGVRVTDIRQSYEIPTGRYKLFTCRNYRQIVISRLKSDLIEMNLANEDTDIRMGLAAGNIYQNKETELKQLFVEEGWFLWTPTEIKKRLRDLADVGYENDPFVISAKLLCR